MSRLVLDCDGCRHDWHLRSLGLVVAFVVVFALCGVSVRCSTEPGHVTPAGARP